MYQVMIKQAEPRSTPMFGPITFPSAEARDAYVKEPNVYWYHYVEEDDWHAWHRGGAWAATAQPGRADVIPDPPEITDDDRW